MSTQEEGSLKVHRSRSVHRPAVTTDGRNLVSHAGTALLSELADRTGLTQAMSGAMADCGISWHTHDPGVVLTHLAVSIADRSEEHTSELQSLRHLVCRLLLEKISTAFSCSFLRLLLRTGLGNAFLMQPRVANSFFF